MCREDPHGLRIRTFHSKRQTFPEAMPQTVEWFDDHLETAWRTFGTPPFAGVSLGR